MSNVSQRRTSQPSARLTSQRITLPWQTTRSCVSASGDGRKYFAHAASSFSRQSAISAGSLQLCHDGLQRGPRHLLLSEYLKQPPYTGRCAGSPAVRLYVELMKVAGDVFARILECDPLLSEPASECRGTAKYPTSTMFRVPLLNKCCSQEVHVGPDHSLAQARAGPFEGLVVTCRLDRRKCAVGRKISDAQMKGVNIVTRDKFHGEWNYAIVPSSP